MLIFRRGDIVAAPYPYVEHPVVRRRPALVVASGLGPNDELVWVLMITSASNQGWEGDVLIETPYDVSGLRAASVVRTAKIATIEARSSNLVGRLSPEDMAKVDSILAEALDSTLP